MEARKMEEEAPVGRKSSGQATAADAVRWNAVEDLVEDWRRRAWAAQFGHYEVAGTSRRRNVALGVPVVIFSAVVGTSLFATLSQANLPLPLRITVGAVSLLAAVMAAIQNFFAFAQLADRHVLAADWYASIRRRIEMIQALPPEARGDPIKFLNGVRKEMNTVGSQFPELTPRVWMAFAERFGVRDVVKDRRRTKSSAGLSPAGPEGDLVEVRE